MTDPLHAIQNEQRRVSDELAAMRGMHVELMKGVGDLCAQLKVLEVQYRESISRQHEMRDVLREHAEKIEAMRINQAGNEYFINLVKTINRNIILALVAAATSAGGAMFVILKG